MKRRLSKTLALFLAMVLAVALASCGNATPATASYAPADTVSSTLEAPGAYPMTFDNYGREITVNARPERVLALGPNCAEMLVALGLKDVIIGTTLRNHSRGPLPEYAADYDNIPELNHASATREAVISSGADFIYGLDWEFGGSGLDIDELNGYGMTTYMNAATTIEQQYQEIRDLGKIFGIEEKAEAFIAGQQARIATVQKKVAGQKPPKVLFIDSFNSGVFTATGLGFANMLLEAAGGENVFKDVTEKQFVTVSYEEALARNPEVIVFFDYDSPPVEEKIEQIKLDSTLSQLEAVKNGRFVIITLESVLAGDRIAYAVETLAGGLYPELFK